MTNSPTHPRRWAAVSTALSLWASLGGAALAVEVSTPGVPQPLSAAVRAQHQAAFQSYADAWGMQADGSRLQTLKDSLAIGMTYHDASTHAEGPSGVDAMILRFQHQSPGVTLRLDDLLLWGDHGLAKWSMIDPKGGVSLHGYDVVTYDLAGHIKTIVGFFEAPGQRVGLPR